MGEIADMMLDGCLCEGCGEYLGEGDGYAVLCAGCSPAKPRKKRKSRRSKNIAKVEEAFEP